MSHLVVFLSFIPFYLVQSCCIFSAHPVSSLSLLSPFYLLFSFFLTFCLFSSCPGLPVFFFLLFSSLIITLQLLSFPLFLFFSLLLCWGYTLANRLREWPRKKRTDSFRILRPEMAKLRLLTEIAIFNESHRHVPRPLSVHSACQRSRWRWSAIYSKEGHSLRQYMAQHVMTMCRKVGESTTMCCHLGR